MKILIVDDSKAMRMIVRRTLRQAGYGDHAVEEACNGAEALRMIQASPPHLVLADWNMPEMTGIELLLALRGTGYGGAFGFVTSEGTPEVHKTALDAGARFVITKPFLPETFREKLAPVLGAS